MKKSNFFCLLGLLTISISCSNEDLEVQETNIELVKNDLAYFDSYDELVDEMRLLNRNGTDDYITNWIFEKGHNSLYLNYSADSNEDENLSLDEFGPTLLAILDKNFQCQVGNDIVSFSNGKYFKQPLSERFNTNFDKVEIGHRTVSIIPIDESGKTELDPTQRVDLWSNGGVSALQDREFVKNSYIDCPSSSGSGRSTRRWRYRQMLTSVQELINSSQLTTVYLECKLYVNTSNGSSSFRYSHSKRNYSYNISGGVRFPGNNYQPFNINITRSCIGGDNQTARWNRLFLADVPLWLFATLGVDGSGTVTHELNGNSASQKWINNINW
jgi:hypothetical protein